MSQVDEDREQLRRAFGALHDVALEKVKAARPKPDTIAYMKRQLQTLPVHTLQAEEQGAVSRLLNLLRVLDSGDVLSLLVTLEYRADANQRGEVLTMLVGDPRRVACLKVLLDDRFYESLGQTLERALLKPDHHSPKPETMP